MPHFYEKNIVEIKEEYTLFLINLITPLLYEGISSLYTYAVSSYKEIEKQRRRSRIENPGILKLFQTLLKEVPDLNNAQIESEYLRVKEGSRVSEWFDDLIKAVIKSNIVLLTYQKKEKSLLVEQRHHEQISPKDFIHKCYIEIARSIYNNPELFSHEFPSLKIKKNQREICEIIKNCIRQAIRKMLPIKLILQEYLSKDYDLDESIDNMKKKVYNDIFENEEEEREREREREPDKENDYAELTHEEAEQIQRSASPHNSVSPNASLNPTIPQQIAELEKIEPNTNLNDEIAIIKADLSKVLNPPQIQPNPDPFDIKKSSKKSQAHKDFMAQIEQENELNKQKSLKEFFVNYQK